MVKERPLIDNFCKERQLIIVITTPAAVTQWLALVEINSV